MESNLPPSISPTHIPAPSNTSFVSLFKVLSFNVAVLVVLELIIFSFENASSTVLPFGWYMGFLYPILLLAPFIQAGVLILMGIIRYVTGNKPGGKLFLFAGLLFLFIGPPTCFGLGFVLLSMN